MRWVCLRRKRITGPKARSEGEQADGSWEMYRDGDEFLGSGPSNGVDGSFFAFPSDEGWDQES